MWILIQTKPIVIVILNPTPTIHKYNLDIFVCDDCSRGHV